MRPVDRSVDATTPSQTRGGVAWPSVFLGLILGDSVIGSLWAIYGRAMQMSTYKIFV
ncbi:MAG TPA: hypothetical protein VK689_21105 [Armatimonadota bacterium]|nr:hypothetical protein [Armatimonadota bacterium]